MGIYLLTHPHSYFISAVGFCRYARQLSSLHQCAPTRRRSQCGQCRRQHVHQELSNRYPSLLLHNFRILNFTTTLTTFDNFNNLFYYSVIELIKKVVLVVFSCHSCSFIYLDDVAILVAVTAATVVTTSGVTAVVVASGVTSAGVAAAA